MIRKSEGKLHLLSPPEKSIMMLSAVKINSVVSASIGSPGGAATGSFVINKTHYI